MHKHGYPPLESSVQKLLKSAEYVGSSAAVCVSTRGWNVGYTRTMVTPGRCESTGTAIAFESAMNVEQVSGCTSFFAVCAASVGSATSVVERVPSIASRFNTISPVATKSTAATESIAAA